MTDTESDSDDSNAGDTIDLVENPCSICNSQSVVWVMGEVRCAFCWRSRSELVGIEPDFPDSRIVDTVRYCSRCGWQPIDVDIKHAGAQFCSSCGFSFQPGAEYKSLREAAD